MGNTQDSPAAGPVASPSPTQAGSEGRLPGQAAYAAPTAATPPQSAPSDGATADASSASPEIAVELSVDHRGEEGGSDSGSPGLLPGDVVPVASVPDPPPGSSTPGSAVQFPLQTSGVTVEPAPRAAMAPGEAFTPEETAVFFAFGLSPRVPPEAGASAVRLSKFQKIFSARTVDMEALRALCWSGCPREFRAASWQLLLGYLPASRDLRVGVVARKRADYRSLVAQAMAPGRRMSEREQAILHQVLKDLPRTAPALPLFHTPALQKSLERVLFLCGLRHPASGYVQGMDDLATVLFAAFLLPFADVTDTSLRLTAEGQEEVEADVYWCLSRVLDGILDHYTPAQPGLQRMVHRLTELVTRVDADLASHLSSLGVEFLQFSFRWFMCVLARDLPLPLLTRLWDTYLCEPAGFDDFHVYVCAALLARFGPDIKAISAEDDVRMLLQELPTSSWGVKDVEQLLSRAFILQSSFQSAPSHLG